MFSNPRLAIVLPVWNGLPYLRTCVESVFHQSFCDWELIIGDDLSSDGSLEYVESLDDPRVRVIRNSERKGIFGNLNVLVREVRAPFCQILCQDDYLLGQNALGQIIEFWSTAGAEIAFARFNHKTCTQCSLTRFERSVLPKSISPNEAPFWFYVFGNILGNLSNNSFRSSSVVGKVSFREDLPFAADWDFWIRLARRSHFAILSDQISSVRHHQKRASVQLNKRGELLSQVREIVGSLFDSVSSNSAKTVRLLRLHGTMNYDSLQRDVALRKLVLGDLEYLKQLDSCSGSSRFIYGATGRWLVFLLSIGGRLMRVSVAKLLLAKHLEGKNRPRVLAC